MAHSRYYSHPNDRCEKRKYKKTEHEPVPEEPPPPPECSTEGRDDFDRAPADPLDGPWKDVNIFQVEAGHAIAYFMPGVYEMAMATTDPHICGVDHQMHFLWDDAAWNFGTWMTAGVHLRLTGLTNMYAVIDTHTSQTQRTMGKVVNGVWTTLHQCYDGGWAGANWMRGTIEGTELKFEHYGKPTHSVIDGDIPGGTHARFFMESINALPNSSARLQYVGWGEV